MNDEFKELTPKNLSFGSIESGKVIKSTNVKITDNKRSISISEESAIKGALENKNNKNEKKENTFTIEPKYNQDIIKEMDITCSCGNYTKIIFDDEKKNESKNNLEEKSEDKINPENEQLPENPITTE